MIKSFPYLIDKNSKILILGSMPGVESLNRQQYYAHPRNVFWRILYTLFNEDYNEDYEYKKSFLKRHNIGLWDVLHTCERKGSLDSDIKFEEINDFNALFKEFPNIEHVFFNGSKAYDSFKKKVGFCFEGVSFHKLCSTSPAHAISFEKKLEQWKIIKTINES
ncbi:DNA-deoxyinosine glycosylase [Clostridium weizhouense]|uniref:DNA-deoxyinosine glycosylase n=1 Tax=Clostridium weizhouense TaxID=2859781 RepID=A0ABS7APX5_9CLOT|nr:DNA-deoxyinosine glycosylase [Clostridium weizhouense]MBW6409560.1 DNA-deoxyinosine glycosylase [Clostridium weizhouense]